jgi:hypothetical protein
MRIRQQITTIENIKKGTLPKKRAVKVFLVREKLKLKTCRELDLTFAVVCAARPGHKTEILIVRQRCRRAGTIVHTGINYKDVRTVENVEPFGQQFEIHRFR